MPAYVDGLLPFSADGTPRAPRTPCSPSARATSTCAATPPPPARSPTCCAPGRRDPARRHPGAAPPGAHRRHQGGRRAPAAAGDAGTAAHLRRGRPGVRLPRRVRRLRTLRVKIRNYGAWERFTESSEPTKVDNQYRGQTTVGGSKTLSTTRQLAPSAPIGPLPSTIAGFGRVGGRLARSFETTYTMQDQVASQGETNAQDHSHVHIDDVYYEISVTDAEAPRPAKPGVLGTGGAPSPPWRPPTTSPPACRCATGSGCGCRTASPPSTRRSAPRTGWSWAPSPTTGSSPPRTTGRSRRYATGRPTGSAPRRTPPPTRSCPRSSPPTTSTRWPTGSPGPSCPASPSSPTTRSAPAGHVHRGARRAGAGRAGLGDRPGRTARDRPADGAEHPEADEDPRQGVLRRRGYHLQPADVQRAGPDRRVHGAGQARFQFGPSVRVGHTRGRYTTLGGSGAVKSVGRAKGTTTDLYRVEKTVYVRRTGDAEPTAFRTWSLDRMTRGEARRLAGLDDGSTLGLHRGSEPNAPAYLTKDHPPTLGMSRVVQFLYANGRYTRTGDGTADTRLATLTDQVVTAVARKYRRWSPGSRTSATRTTSGGATASTTRWCCTTP
ncbi:hypothetical protein NKH77_28700 [Streptomyces sp. M19]